VKNLFRLCSKIFGAITTLVKKQIRNNQTLLENFFTRLYCKKFYRVF